MSTLNDFGKMSKWKQIGNEEKYYAILRIEKKECSQQQIAEELGVNKATVSKWMEETTRAQIKKIYQEDNVQADRKKLRVSKYPE